MEILAYSSVKGEFHKQKDISNQDSYIVKKYKIGTILVVSDGIGSHIHSKIGSEAVCKSVCQAIQFWNQYECRDIRLLIPLIHSMWNVNIFPYLKNECGATCLFAFIDNSGMLYVGQLGDGDIYVSINEEVELIKVKEDEFTNFTSGINSTRNLKEWTLKEYNIVGKRLKLCLMTDGVSETLIENKKVEFVKLLWQKISEKENLSKRNNFIYNILSKWVKINSGDDRTIISFEKR